MPITYHLSTHSRVIAQPVFSESFKNCFDCITIIFNTLVHILSLKFCIFVYLFLWVGELLSVPQHMCEGERTTCGNCFSSTVWIPETKVRLSGLAASAVTEPSGQPTSAYCFTCLSLHNHDFRPRSLDHCKR